METKSSPLGLHFYIQDVVRCVDIKMLRIKQC